MLVAGDNRKVQQSQHIAPTLTDRCRPTDQRKTIDDRVTASSHRVGPVSSSLTPTTDTNELRNIHSRMDGNCRQAQVTDVAVRPGHVF